MGNPVTEAVASSPRVRRLALGLRTSGAVQALLVALIFVVGYGLLAPGTSEPALDDARWDRSFDAVEVDADGEAFRWMRRRGAVSLPRLSTAPHLLLLELQNVRPDQRTVALRLEQGVVVELSALPGRRVYRLLLPGSAMPPPDTLALEAETFRPEGDRRELSLVLRAARAEPLGVGIPWWLATGAGLLLQVVLLALLLRSVGAPERLLPLAAVVVPLELFGLGTGAYGPAATRFVWVAAAVVGGVLVLRRVSHGVTYRELRLHHWERADYLAAVGLAVAAVGLRVVLAPHVIPLLNGDDYLTGTFAANIVRRGWHALYYGHHTGAISAYLVAPAMAVGGIGHNALLVLPFALTSVLIVAIYGLGCDLAGRWAGVAAALWIVLPGATALWWSMKPQPGYLEAVAAGTLMLWGTVRLLWGEAAETKAIWLMAGVALAATLAVWAGLVIASAVLVCGLLAVIRWRRLLALPLAGYAVALGIGLLLLVPTGIYIVERPGDNPLWWVVGRDTQGLPPGEALRGLWTRTLPLALGIERPWPLEPVEPAVGLVIALLAAGGVLVALTASIGVSRAALVPVSLATAVALLFCFSSFNTLHSDVRYILPLYIALPLFAGLFVANVRRQFGVPAAALLMALVIGANSWSGLGMRQLMPHFEREEARLASDLAERQIAYVHTSYWIGQVLMVESGGEILASAMLGPNRESYDRRVENAVLAANPAQVALLTRKGDMFDEPLQQALREQQVRCEIWQSESFTVYSSCTPFPSLAELQARLGP